MEPVYCGKCGTQNSTGSDFCVNCGIKLHPALVEVSTETAPSTSPTVKGKPAWNRTKYLAVFIILILIVAALFGSGLGQQLLSGTHPPLLSQATTATSTVTNLSGSTSQTTAETSTLASSLATVSRTTTLPHMPPSVFLSAPPAPKAVGCYSYSQAGWEKVPCVPHQGKNTEALPQSAPSQAAINTQGNFFGIYSNQFGTTQPCWQANCDSNVSPSSPILTYSVLMVNIRQYGGEQDIETPGSNGSHGYDHSKPYGGGCGDGAYSLQLNTNYFPGKNGHQDWVQFMYNDDGADGNQQFEVNPGCNGRPELCIGNVNTDTNDYSQINCVKTPDIRPTNNLEVILECYVVDGLLAMYGYLNGVLYSVVEPDVYGLEGRWTMSSGGMMGYGGSSEAEWGPNPTNLQTDIGVSSCKNPTHGDLFLDCPAPAITATYNPQGPTGESSNLAQYGPLFTSYYRGTHWWLSSVRLRARPTVESSRL